MQHVHGWKSGDFKTWRADMVWSQSQAAHVLMAGRRIIIAWENEDQPIPEHVIERCKTIEMLHAVAGPDFFGDFDTLLNFHRPLLRRKAEAEALPGRERCSLELARDRLYRRLLTTGTSGDNDAEESLLKLEKIFERDDAILGRLHKKSDEEAEQEEELLDADGYYILYTRVYELVAPNDHKPPNV